MITLQKLKWSNCFSYGADNEIDLAESTLTQLLGPNGVGKSSICYILEEVLFNKNSKGVKKSDIANRSLNEGYSISLQFLVDENTYKVSVVRAKSTLKIKLLKNEEDISSHTATNTFKTIEQILGVDFKTFSQLIYQSTTSSLQFLTATDATRKKFLIDLLNLSKYVDFFDLFKAQLKEFNTKVAVLGSKVDTLEAWMGENNLKGMKVLPSINLEIFTEKDEQELASLRVEFERIDENNKKIIKNNHYIEQLEKFDLSAISSIKAIGLGTYDELTLEVGKLQAEQSAARTVIEKMNSLGNSCPTCSQRVDDQFKFILTNHNDIIIEKATKEIDSLGKRITEVKENNKDFKKKQKLESTFENLFRSVNKTLPTEVLNAGDLEYKIEELSGDIKQKNQRIKEIITQNLVVERNNTKISLIKEQTAKFEEQLVEVNEEFAEVQKVYNNLDILKKAFSTNGLIAYKIENLVKELETIVNEYLSELSDGRFTLEFVVVKDKLNVDITDNGYQVDILSLSSGELARVNTATLLAIRKLMNSISKSQINVLFLDEIIGVLDTTGREKLVEVLLEESNLNTYIVSHEWSHPLLAKLVVSKAQGISRIIYG